VNDATTAPLEASADIAAFNDKDARYVQAAAGRLRKPGDCVVIESQHLSLRDHYIKQILSISFNRNPELTIQRCGKERDWMIARLNKAIESAGQGIKASQVDPVGEIWVLELSGTEDFELLKLGHTLANQFPAAGICLLVSCSQVLADYPQFSRYSERLGIPMWRFGMPDDDSMRAFLNRESEHGAVNQARQLVSDLETARSNAQNHQLDFSSKSVAAAISPKPILTDGVPILHLKEQSSRPSVSIETKTSVRANGKPGKLSSKKRKSNASHLIGEGTKRDGSGYAGPNKTTALMLFAITLSFVLTLGLVVTLFEIPVNRMSKELVQTMAPSVFGSGVLSADNSEGEISKPVEKDGQELLMNGPAEVSVLSSDEMSTSDAQTSGANRNVDRIDSEGGDVTKSLGSVLSRVEPGVALRGGQEQSDVSGSSSVDFQTTEAILSIDDTIYAQFGAFSNRATAAKFRLQIQDTVPEAFIAEKTNGMWSIVSGPYVSRERVPNKISQSSIRPYFIVDSELVMSM